MGGMTELPAVFSLSGRSGLCSQSASVRRTSQRRWLDWLIPVASSGMQHYAGPTGSGSAPVSTLVMCSGTTSYVLAASCYHAVSSAFSVIIAAVVPATERSQHCACMQLAYCHTKYQRVNTFSVTGCC